MRPLRRLRHHPAPQIEPETLHPQIDDEPWESQIERASVPLPLIVPKRDEEEPFLEQLAQHRLPRPILVSLAAACYNTRMPSRRILRIRPVRP